MFFGYQNPFWEDHLVIFPASIISRNSSSIFNLSHSCLAISTAQPDKTGLEPVYRFLNTNLGSHLFTAFEEEKDHLLSLSGFVFEGVAFRAFSSDSSSTVAVHRFFNAEIGGHFFTSNQVEMEAVSEMQQFRYEGEAFYAYSDLGL